MKIFFYLKPRFSVDLLHESQKSLITKLRLSKVVTDLETEASLYVVYENMKKALIGLLVFIHSSQKKRKPSRWVVTS